MASVTKGMNGWRSRMPCSSTKASTWRVAWAWTAVPSLRRTLAASMYQSQYSFQRNS